MLVLILLRFLLLYLLVVVLCFPPLICGLLVLHFFVPATVVVIVFVLFVLHLLLCDYSSFSRLPSLFADTLSSCFFSSVSSPSVSPNYPLPSLVLDFLVLC